MATPNAGILTQTGLDMFNKVENGQDTITYTNMVYSSDDLLSQTDEQLEQTIDLNSKNLTLPTQSFINSDGITEIRSNGNNKGVTSGFYVNTYGIYAHGTDNVEFLYGLIVDDKPSYVTPYDGVSPQSLVMSWLATITRTKNVTLTASSAVYATIDDITNERDAIIKQVGEAGFIKATDDVNFTGKLQYNGNEVATVASASSATQSLADSAYTHASSDLSSYASNNDLKQSVASNTTNITSLASAKADNDKALQYRGDWSGVITDLKDQPDGTYQLKNNIQGGPDWFDGYGIATKTHNDTDTFIDLIDNLGNKGNWCKYGGWKQDTHKDYVDSQTASQAGSAYAQASSDLSSAVATVNTELSTKADKTYVDSQTALQFENAVATANAYTNNFPILKTPPENLTAGSMLSGDSFDNYAGKLTRLNMSYVDPTSVSASLGLPSALIKGVFTSIPSTNLTEQWVVDDWGNRWYRVTGQAWSQVFTSSLGSVHDYRSRISITGLNGVDTSGAYGIFDPSTNTVTLHGKAIYTTTENQGTVLFSLDTSKLNMNKIVSQNLRSNTLIANMNNVLTNVMFTNTVTNSATPGTIYWYSLDGYTVDLGYDPSLKPTAPSFAPGDVQVISTPFDANNILSETHYFVTSTQDATNTPSDLGTTSPNGFLIYYGLGYTNNYITENIQTVNVDGTIGSKKYHRYTSLSSGWNSYVAKSTWYEDWEDGFDPYYHL